MSRKYTYVQKTDRLNKSYDSMLNSGMNDPWKLLASAIIFQAAVDCQNWKPEIEQPVYNSSGRNGLRYQRRGMLIKFINSDWLDFLLSWQQEIKPHAVREELMRRLNHEIV